MNRRDPSLYRTQCFDFSRLRFLDAEQVLRVHEIGLQRWGGAEGGGHRGYAYEGVEAAIRAVQNSYYARLTEIAAAYAVYIIQGHVFMDGNKRAGAFAMETFLQLNGYRLVLSKAKTAALMLILQRVSEQGAATTELIAWLARQLRLRKMKRR